MESNPYPSFNIPNDNLPPDQFPTDIPDEMYLPSDFLRNGDIVPVLEEKLVLANENEFIKCQWFGCGGQFKGSIREMKAHIIGEHLREPMEEWSQKRQKFLSEFFGRRLTRDQKNEAIKDAKVAKCLWMVNNRIPCADWKVPVDLESDKSGYRQIDGMVKHVGRHLYREGLPNPFAKESECCGYRYFDTSSREHHTKECENKESKKPQKKKRKLNPEGDEDEDEDEGGEDRPDSR